MALAQRRKFCAAEKHRILNLADDCTDPGDIGALLRREGIYSSHLASWRKHHKTSELAMAAEQKRGPKTKLATAMKPKANSTTTKAAFKAMAMARP
ncbi:hypothetical protein ACFQAT_13580 [Undibacterium arcticum]|uniref:hypothetical protein n=1 Tax=Undibacterium arcticum TaxID=1762892 RepID=UPI003620C2F3